MILKALLPAVVSYHALLRRSAGADHKRFGVLHRVGKQDPEVALTVTDGDNPRGRAGRRQFPRLHETLDPASAVGLGISPEVRIHREQAEAAALCRYRKPGVSTNADAALATPSDLTRPVQTRCVASRPVSFRVVVSCSARTTDCVRQ